jgi:hypothetical protein
MERLYRCSSTSNVTELLLGARISIDIGISGLVVEYIVAIDVTRVRFPADAHFGFRRRPT